MIFKYLWYAWLIIVKNILEESLDSILNQDTSFKYEVIVHDDASTDHTAEIIREYEKKYPDKIVAIYQKENLYSKGVAIIEEQMLDKAKGKYIAFCECDDKWTDSRKLEMQYDYMGGTSRMLDVYT